MNHVWLMGRLTKDVELRYTQAGKAFAFFRVAVDRRNEGADFIDCQAWEKLAENLTKYCSKGSLIAIDGRIQVDSEQKDGKYLTYTKIICNDIRFLNYKDSQSQNAQNNGQSVPQQPADAFIPDIDEDDDMPF